MFGINVSEMVIIGLLFLVLFGPKQIPQMARDIGRFVNEAQRAVEEFKEELMAEDDHLDYSANSGPPRRPKKTEKEEGDEPEEIPTGTSGGADEFSSAVKATPSTERPPPEDAF